MLAYAHHKVIDGQGKGGAVEHYLAVVGQKSDNVIEHVLEVLRQKFVCLIQNHHGASIHPTNTLV